MFFVNIHINCLFLPREIIIVNATNVKQISKSYFILTVPVLDRNNVEVQPIRLEKGTARIGNFNYTVQCGNGFQRLQHFLTIQQVTIKT